jgi:hypothetical protein
MTAPSSGRFPRGRTRGVTGQSHRAEIEIISILFLSPLSGLRSQYRKRGQGREAPEGLGLEAVSDIGYTAGKRGKDTAQVFRVDPHTVSS